MEIFGKKVLRKDWEEKCVIQEVHPPQENYIKMSRLVDHLAMAQKKIIKSRRQGLSFDPKKMVKIPLLVEPAEWKGEQFKDFGNKVDQARVIIFTVLPGMGDPDHPNTLIISSLWGKVLVTRVRELVKYTEDSRHMVQGWEELRESFRQPHTAYITEWEDKTLKWMKMLGVELDEAAVTGLETWHTLAHEFCPSLVPVFGELWGRITAPFRGSISSRWAWNQHISEESVELAPDQARLAFVVGKAMSSLTLDRVVARIDPENGRPLDELGLLGLKSEREGILEAEETLGMRALQLETKEEAGTDAGAGAKLRVS